MEKELEFAMATAREAGKVMLQYADEIIDYKTQDFTEILHDYDTAFDTVGGDDFNKSLVVLKKGGRAVSMIGHADPAKANELGITALTQGTKVTTAILDRLCQLTEEGVITPQIDTSFPLEEIQQAFQARESGTATGKIVLEIKSEADERDL